jgi:hypothetical protein
MFKKELSDEEYTKKMDWIIKNINTLMQTKINTKSKFTLLIVKLWIITDKYSS